MSEWPGNPPDWWLRYHSGGSRSSDAGSDQMVKLVGEVKIETEKAIQFYDGSKTVWLARSLIEIDSDGTVWCPEWLATKERLT